MHFAVPTETGKHNHFQITAKNLPAVSGASYLYIISAAFLGSAHFIRIL